MSNSLDPDQARCVVGPDMSPNCLQRLSADNTSCQRVIWFFFLLCVPRSACLFVFMLYIPVNNFSVMSGHVPVIHGFNQY